MEVKFLRHVIFKGRTAGAVQLGTILTLGRFWVRLSGIQLLYSAAETDDIDFDSPVAAAETDSDSIEVSIGSGSKMVYILRRCNRCGDEEKTLSASAAAEIDSSGQLVSGTGNRVFAVSAFQTAPEAISLCWFYNPIAQAAAVSGFKIYSDNGSGSIDYSAAAAQLKYRGRKFYRCSFENLSADSYKFCIRVVGSDGSEDGYSGCVSVDMNRRVPEGPSFIKEQIE